MGFFIALQFLTRLPSPVRLTYDEETLGRSLQWFPAVGLALGLLAAGAEVATRPIVGDQVAAIVAIASLLALSGALHFDGLLDTCDGLFCQKPPDSRLAVMRDSHVGAFGVAGGVLVLLAKYSAIVSLTPELRTPALLLAPCLGRWSIVLAAFLFPYARSHGLGKCFHEQAKSIPVVISSLTAVGGASVLLAWAGLLLMVAASLVVLAIGLYAMSKLAGLTGDVYGAISETVEAVTLALVPACVALIYR